MKTITNFFLSNLAAADIFFIVSSAVIGFWRYGASHGISHAQTFRSVFGCLSSIAVVYFTYLASMIIVILVSLERYLAICHPVKYRSMNKSKKGISAKLASITWFAALCFAFVISPFQGKLTKKCIVWPPRESYSNMPTKIYICEPLNEAYRDVMACAQAIPFIIAVAVIIVLYAQIIHTLKAHTVGEGSLQQQPASIRKVQQQVTRMVITNGLVYFICLAPFQIIYICDIIWRANGKNLFAKDWALTLLLISRCMLALNSAINPVIYALVNPKYRRAFVRFVRCTAGNRVDPMDATSAIDASDIGSIA